MILLYIYLGISIITLLMSILISATVVQKFKRWHSNLKVPKSSIASKWLAFLKLVIGSFIPIVNVGILWVYIFNGEELETRAILKLYHKCMEEPENGMQ